MRKLWINSLVSIASPILEAASKEELKLVMPVFRESNESQYLEAIGRIVCGIAPWFSLSLKDEDEYKKCNKLKNLTISTLINIVNPNSKEYIDFGLANQSIVDVAYLCQGLLRCPILYEELPLETKKQFIKEIKKTRKFIPPETNWLLFASMIEAFLLSINEEIIENRLLTPIDKFLNIFYIGDGMYGDGLNFHFDYYNSYVIHPMLTDILETLEKNKINKFKSLRHIQEQRLQRYVVLLERMISPSGTWPVIGRTLSCKIGVFNALSYASYKKLLPTTLEPEQVRCALHSVLQTFISNSNNFDSKSFLTVGLNGIQPDIAEGYISSGSPYYAVTFFIALGLSQKDDFWIKPDKEWTSLKAFSEKKILPDYAYDENYGVKSVILKLLKLSLELIKHKMNIGKTK